MPIVSRQSKAAARGRGAGITPDVRAGARRRAGSSEATESMQGEARRRAAVGVRAQAVVQPGARAAAECASGGA